MASAVRGKIVSVFKLHGLSLKTEATKFLTEVLSPLTEVELEDWLDKIHDCSILKSHWNQEILCFHCTKKSPPLLGTRQLV